MNELEKFQKDLKDKLKNDRFNAKYDRDKIIEQLQQENEDLRNKLLKYIKDDGIKAQNNTELKRLCNELLREYEAVLCGGGVKTIREYRNKIKKL